MRKLLALLVALVAVPLLLRSYAREDRPAGSGGISVPTQPASTAAPDGSAPQNEIAYLDVRSPEEYAQGHVQDALFIPVEQLEQRIAELYGYRDRELVVYCRSGRRSARAVDLLSARGFTRVSNGGGFESLVREKSLAIERFERN